MSLTLKTGVEYDPTRNKWRRGRQTLTTTHGKNDKTHTHKQHERRRRYEQQQLLGDDEEGQRNTALSARRPRTVQAVRGSLIQRVKTVSASERMSDRERSVARAQAQARRCLPGLR